MDIKINNRKVTWHRIKNAYVLFNMRQGRGAGYIDRFRDLFVLSGAFKIFFPTMPIYLIIPIGFIWMLTTYYIGFLDETRLKIWQIELEKNATWINPFNQRVDKKLKQIHHQTKK